jgi:hypothetical protein
VVDVEAVAEKAALAEDKIKNQLYKIYLFFW